MTLSQILFGLSGRLARLQYLGYSLVGIVLIVVALAFVVNIFAVNVGLGLIGIAVLGLAAIWISIATAVKRLHDLGLSGGHVIWIIALGMMSRSMGPNNAGLAILFGLAEIVAWLWLVFAPGQPAANAYGPEPA
jgi:uncharacterized membrane protein YhaH (DUF805 family)